MTHSQDIAWLLKEKYEGLKSEAFESDVERLKRGEPLAYVIGHVPFLNTTIFLDSKPLIPRPETEYWTEQAIHKINKNIPNDTPLTILDLCAGSGCIGVAVAKNVADAHVDFVELDKNHIKTIEKNCQQNEITSQRIKVLVGDLRELSEVIGDKKYSYIFSNPPYIDKSLNRTEESVTEHEPEIALFGGQDGFELIAAIIEQAPKHLKFGGELWLEHEPEQVEQIVSVGNRHGFKVISHKDQFAVLRFSQLVLQ